MSDLVKVMNRIPFTNQITNIWLRKYLIKKYGVKDVVIDKKVSKNIKKHIHLWIKSTNIMNWVDLISEEEITITKENETNIFPIIIFFEIKEDKDKNKILYYSYNIYDVYKNSKWEYVYKIFK